MSLDHAASPHVLRMLYAMGVFGCVFAQESADAHCLYPGQADDSYRAAFPDPQDPSLVGPIDVYLSDAALSSIEHTGLTIEEFTPILRATLSELNTHLKITTLRFAGVHSVDPVDNFGALSLLGLPDGITVGSFDCEGAYAPCEPNQVPGLGGCNRFPSQAEMMIKPGTALVSLVPGACESLASPMWTPAGVLGRDPIHVLLHELGHALGLDHSNLVGTECSGLEDGDNLPNPGVMWSAVAAFARSRRLLRDDIEALEVQWGTSNPSSLWHWNDATSFPADPDLCALAPLGGISGVPVSISSSIDEFDLDVSFMALTDADARVKVLEGSASGFPAMTGATEVDPSLPSGRTLHPMGMSMGRSGNEAIPLVVWLTGETRTSYDLGLRWAIRTPAGAWEATNAELPEGVDAVDRRVSAGFDPTSGYFLATAVTQNATLLIVAIGVAGNQAAVTQLNDPLVYDVGSATCVTTTGVCTLPIMTSELGGPEYAWLQVELAGDGTATSLGVQSADTTGIVGTSGAPSLAVWTSGAFTGTGVRGVLGERRFGSLVLPPDSLTWDDAWYANNGWPLRIGSINPPGGDPVFPTVTRRFEAPYECGNNIVECNEECDDGNLVSGDGCTLCTSDVEGLDSGSGDGGSPGNSTTGSRDTDSRGSATNGGGNGGCNCQTQPTPIMTSLLLLGLLGATRRSDQLDLARGRATRVG